VRRRDRARELRIRPRHARGRARRRPRRERDRGGERGGRLRPRLRGFVRDRMTPAEAHETAQPRAWLPELGKSLLGLAHSARGTYRIFALTLYFSVRGTRERHAVLRQMYEIGNRSLVFLCVVMGFLGMIVVYQAGLQTQRVVPDLSNLGATYL